MTVNDLCAPTAREALRRVKDELGRMPSWSPTGRWPTVSRSWPCRSDSPDASPPKRRPPYLGTTRPHRQANGEADPSGADDDYTVTLSAKAHGTNAVPAMGAAAAGSSMDERPPLRPLPPAPSVRRRRRRRDRRALFRNVPLAMHQRAAKTDFLISPWGVCRPALARRQKSRNSWRRCNRSRPCSSGNWPVSPGRDVAPESDRPKIAWRTARRRVFSALARRLIDELPGTLTPGDGAKWLMAGAVNRRLRTLSGDSDIVDQGRRVRAGRPHRRRQDDHDRQAGGEMRGALWRRPAGALTTDSWDRRPRTVAHLRPHSRRAGPRGARRRRPAAPLVDLRDKHMMIDTVGKHESARSHGRRAGGDADPPAMVRRLPADERRRTRRYAGRRSARLCRRDLAGCAS